MCIRWIIAVLIGAAAVAQCRADAPAKMLSERAACALLMQRLARTVASDCLYSNSSDGHSFVVTLTEHCGLCTYALTDWYTVDRRTGAIQKPGKPSPRLAPPNGKLHWTAD
jgi:hypothetical protein